MSASWTRERALEERIGELAGYAKQAENGIRASCDYLQGIRNRHRDPKIDMELGDLEWLLSALHGEIDRLHDLTDFEAEPIDEPEEAEPERLVPRRAEV